MEGGPKEPVSKSEDETGKRGEMIGGEEESVGMGEGGSIGGGIPWPLPKHHAHEMGGLRVDSPPWGWGLVCLHLVLTDSKSQRLPSKTGVPTLEFPPPGLWACPMTMFVSISNVAALPHPGSK